MSESVYSLYEKGHGFLESGHPHQAVVLLERAAAAEPEKGSIREALGRALYMTGSWARAAEEFGKAVEIDPVNHYAHFGLGLAHERSGDGVKAVAHLRLAVAMDSREEDREALERLTPE